MVFPFSTSFTPDAPVGLGPVDGMPPQLAHEPMAMIAQAFAAVSFSISIAVCPPTLQ